MYVRGIRGAISVENNTSEEILKATSQLLIEMVERNEIATEDITSVIFTVTNDLDVCFPAAAARKLGWTYVPLLCSMEIPVIGSPDKLVKVLMHVNTNKTQDQIQHVYLKRAKILRPDLVKE
ncbi:MAG: chorismate mutase [Bacillota bacterium]